MKKKNVPGVIGQQIPTSQQGKRNAAGYQRRIPPSRPNQKSQLSNDQKGPTPLAQRQMANIKKPIAQQTSSHSGASSRSRGNPNQINSHQISNQRSKKEIPAISNDYEKLRQRLQELKDLLNQIKEKWERIETQKVAEHKSIMDQLNKNHLQKIRELEGSFTPQSKQDAMTKQIQAMKDQAEAFKNEGNMEKYQAMMRQAKSVETQMFENERYSKMREIEARKQPLLRAQQIKIQQTKEQQKAEIDKIHRERDEELKPIQEEYDKLDKRLHGDAEKVARSPLCRKD
ncbi:hypothetical protein TRFO_36585 [Tritrichomonas foetus]|uniref:Uncharacterized protein n=1 Tax=Tritrichomonas foetus TaxID=1144522 RepID=A0A1J4JDQ4_9EUKA|nr:hypothetical protein TRFO_36585 [Tritrichomonas foetus]|eukprot:OHS97232.1 hypothetical protein TRFO_36585 [Tritrichomonas foetus]